MQGKEIDDLESRLQEVEAVAAQMREDAAKIAKLVRGNGDLGLMGQVLTNSERIAQLQGQWRWIVGILAGLVIAVGKRLLVG